MVAIAAISLLVGGIGIMNIVLATVLERTREIGIRRATGARRGDIVRQFLLESVLISIGGGVVGIAFGYFLSWLIARDGGMEDNRDAGVGRHRVRRIGGGRRGFRDLSGDEKLRGSIRSRLCAMNKNPHGVGLCVTGVPRKTRGRRYFQQLLQPEIRCAADGGARD